MLLQGDLQSVFDALYEVGAVDPMLKMDWHVLHEQVKKNPFQMECVIREINSCRGDRDLMVMTLSKMDQNVVYLLAMEVARELAEFTDRETLH